MVEEMLFRVGIPTYKTTLQIDLPAAAQVKQLLNQKAPINIGWIYGISINVDGHLPLDNSANLITKTDAGNLWLSLLIGSNQFVADWRLSELMYMQYNVDREMNWNYAPVSLPMGSDAKGNSQIDWQKSYVTNPSGIVSKTILLNLWYIDIASYSNLVNSKFMWVTGVNPN